jgi:outer membrane protein TolC
MLKNIFLILIASFALLIAPLAALSQEPVQLSLSEAYEIARAQSELLLEDQELLAAAEAQYQQALSALYPSIRFLANQRYRSSLNYGRTATTNSSEFGDDTAPNNIGSRSSHPYEAFVSLRQPLFTGFRESLVASAKESSLEAKRLNLERKMQLLYLDVAEVYTQIQWYEDDKKLIKKTEAVLDERIAELRKFLDLGKARTSEIEAATADKAALGAAHSRVQGLLDASKELLSFLIARPIGQFKIAPFGPAEKLDPLIEEQLQRAHSRSDVRASKMEVAASIDERRAAERGHLPTLYLEGNSYVAENPDNNRDWELLFRFDLPIYEGGLTQARIAEQRARQRAAEVKFKGIERSALKDVRLALSDVDSRKRELELIEKQLVAAQRSREAQVRDYKLGLVTNLEVLGAIRNELEAKRQLLNTQALQRIDAARLRVASGDL